MSQSNDDLTEVIANLNSDVQKFSDLIKCLSDYEQKIDTHINKLKKFEKLQSVAASALKLTDGSKTIANITESLERNLQIIFADNELKRQEKQITQSSKQSVGRDENPESINHSAEKEHEQEFGHQSRVNSVVMSNGKQEGDQFVTGSTIKDIVNNYNENAAVDMNELNELKLGTIRVVPLQNLLSTPNKCSYNEPLLQLTISDSDDDDHTAKISSTYRLKDEKKHNIFILSDSDNEQSEYMLKQKLENRKSQEKRVPTNQITFSEKPRKKITPVRNFCEKLSQNEKRKRISACSDEDPVGPPKRGRNGQKSENDHTNSIISKENPVSKANRSDNFVHSILNNASKDSCGKNELFSPRNSTVSSMPEASAAITKPSTIVNSYLKKNCNYYQKKCVVRIKRTTFLTVNNIKVYIH